jgi:DDE family transposase
VTPVGMALPTWDDRLLYGITSTVTSACLGDGLMRGWEVVHERFAPLTTLVINLDNGPENHSRRTQCLRRIVAFAPQTGLTVRLADSPPSHRKYHPIERCWGILDNHWNGALLDSIEAVLRWATTMTWKGKCPVVALVTTTSQTGVKLTKDAMQKVETQLQRLPGLDQWFVDIVPTSSTIPAT